MGHTNYNDLDDIQMLGRCEFDKNYNWVEHTVPHNLHDFASNFVLTKKDCESITVPTQHSAPNHTLSSNQEKALNIITAHNKGHSLCPLSMVIQGTDGIGKSHLITCIRDSLNDNIQTQRPQILILAPIGVVATTIHKCNNNTFSTQNSDQTLAPT